MKEKDKEQVSLLEAVVIATVTYVIAGSMIYLMWQATNLADLVQISYLQGLGNIF